MLDNKLYRTHEIEKGWSEVLRKGGHVLLQKHQSYYQSSDYSLCISYVTINPRGGDINDISDGLSNPNEE